MGLRGDAIVQFDWSVEQIMDALQRNGLDDNTIVIVTSDNGPVVDDGYDDKAEELLNGHSPSGPFRGHKYSAFEGGTMIPMIIRWPGKVEGGKVNDALMSQIDLMRSFGELIGARLPKGSAPDSENHLSTFMNRDTTSREYVPEMSSSRVMSVRSGNWKYIEPSNGSAMITWGPKIETGNRPEPQLYNIADDIGETHNVAAENPDIVAGINEYINSIR